MLRAVSGPEDDAPAAPAEGTSAGDDAWLSDRSLTQPPPTDAPPAQPAAWAPPSVAAPRGRRSLKGFFIAYFAAGIALLVAGTVAVVYLGVRAYGPPTPTPEALQPTPGATSRRTTGSTTPSPSTGPNGNALGPQRLAMGRVLGVAGEDGAKFEVTVRAGKFRRTACDEYSVKPKNGGYLPTEIRVKVLEGVPDVSDFDFRFQKPDGEWLDSVGGTGCDKNYGALFRRLVAGRTYSTTVVFDVPRAMKGDIVFVWPLRDVVGSWKVG
jgi:hypothetical protein